MGTDTGFRCPIGNMINLGLESFGSWMALIRGRDNQGGQGFALVSPEHPEAAFEAVSEVV